MPMTPYRDSIRIAIFEKISNDIADISEVEKQVVEIINQYAKKYPNFEQKEKINLELTVPIKIPPGGKKGDCKVVVTLVKTEFNKLGGGARIQSGEGSWLDKQQNVVSDECLIVFTAMPLANWVDCISVLKKLIKEIQSKLKQQCVFLRVDNQTYGDPINLLGEVADSFPSNSEFGDIDKACLIGIEEYQEIEIISVIGNVTQEITGDNNFQMNAGGSIISATEGGIVAKGNVTIGTLNSSNEGIEIHGLQVGDHIRAEKIRIGKDSLAAIGHFFQVDGGFEI